MNRLLKGWLMYNFCLISAALCGGGQTCSTHSLVDYGEMEGQVLHGGRRSKVL